MANQKQGIGGIAALVEAATFVFGLVLFATDLHASFAVLLEVRGLVLGSKLLMLYGALQFPTLAAPLLLAAMLTGTWISHVSRKVRHRLWWNPGRAVTADRRRG